LQLECTGLGGSIRNMRMMRISCKWLTTIEERERRKEIKILRWDDWINSFLKAQIKLREIFYANCLWISIFFKKFNPLSPSFLYKTGDKRRRALVEPLFSSESLCLASRFPEKSNPLLRYIIFHVSTFPSMAMIRKWSTPPGFQCEDLIVWNNPLRLRETSRIEKVTNKVQSDNVYDGGGNRNCSAKSLSTPIMELRIRQSWADPIFMKLISPVSFPFIPLHYTIISNHSLIP
jgi:hypothetical protein